MDNSTEVPGLPPEMQTRLAEFMTRMPADWRVLAVRQQGRDWVVDLTNDSGQVVSQLMLLAHRSPDETHGAQPRY